MLVQDCVTCWDNTLGMLEVYKNSSPSETHAVIFNVGEWRLGGGKNGSGLNE